MVDRLADANLPRAIGRYEVVGRLGTGGMAEIFLGRMVGPGGFERPVVIKRILPHLAQLSEFVDMFLDEARIVASIRHPNVVHVEELGRHEADLFLVMEYLEGESAAGVIRRLLSRHQRLDHALAAHVVAEACAGLHAAHELTDADGRPRNVVHRDVSPQNVFVTYDGAVKVLDFGIAHAADRTTRTETGLLKGKVEYMSPEQCAGRPIDRRSDVFALGIVLYELSTGHRLFKRNGPLETLRAISEESVTAPSAVVDGYPPVLERICLRALARRAEDRYPSAAEMRKDLVLAGRELSSDAVPAEALAALMHDAFPDRIVEKSDMLRRVRSGAAVARVSEAETDVAVDVPEVPFGPEGPPTQTATSSRVRDVKQDAPRRSSMTVVALAIAAVAIGALAYTLRVPRLAVPRSAAASETASEPTATSPTTSPAGGPPPSDSASVTIAVETTPPGAEVDVDGVPQGTTPLTVRAPRGKKEISLQVMKDGYATARQTMSAEADQRIALTLTPLRRPAAPAPRAGVSPRPKARTSPRPSASSGFYLLP